MKALFLFLLLCCITIQSIQAQDSIAAPLITNIHADQDSVADLEALLKLFDQIELKTKVDSISYSFGVSMKMNRSMVNMDDMMFLKGYFDNQFDTVLLSNQMSIQYIRARNAERRRLRRLRNNRNRVAAVQAATRPTISEDSLNFLKAINVTRITKGEQFLAKNTQKEGITVTESGLQYEKIIGGSGSKPSTDDKVKLYIRCVDIFGNEYYSTDGLSTMDIANTVIPFYKEALPLISVGATYKFYVPYDLAFKHVSYKYNDKAREIPEFETLVYTIELITILE